jgi:excinuclease UvrABC ATPase subunit
VVITGLSGSGKSSLAFDTIFAEGHRRYVENRKWTRLKIFPPSLRSTRPT